ncbi:MAG: hypothetical protein KC656_23125, partial [Myxococcales bacterium]|nr:hypothetical protein [Myxococcales bacterium]
ISGAEDHLPEAWSVSLTERPMDVRARFRVLFEPIAKPWSRRIDPTSDPDHHAMLRLVDQVEADTLGAVDRKLTALLDEQLEPTTALRVLPSLEHALKQVAHALDEELAHAIEPLPSPEPPAPPDDPGLHTLERVIDGRPGLASTWPVLLALTGGVTAVIVLFVSWLVVPPPAGISSTPVPPTSTEAWAVGLLLGMLVAGVWQIGVLWSWRADAREQLTKRTHELDAAWKRGGAGQEREQAERLLAVRRRRTAHDLRRRYQSALERLGGLRAAIRQSRNAASTALADLRVRIGALPSQDDLSGLVGTDSPLHGSLVGPEVLAQRLEGAGSHRDLQRWAAQILTDTWPASGGIEVDLPCLDTARLLAACDQALGPLDASTLLGGEAETATNARSFVARAVPALGFGVTPRDVHGDPVAGLGRSRVLLVAPSGLRGGVEGALADSPVQLEPLWTGAAVPWMSLLAVWDGFSADQVARGMGR